jgi:hypothetical protein
MSESRMRWGAARLRIMILVGLADSMSDLFQHDNRLFVSLSFRYNPMASRSDANKEHINDWLIEDLRNDEWHMQRESG